MSLKQLNSKVIMKNEERTKFINKIKEKEQMLKTYITKNGNEFKIKKVKKRLFFIRGSFEKYLFLKTTSDCDVHLFLNCDSSLKNIDDIKNVMSWRSKLEAYLKKIYGNQVKKYATTKPSIDITLYDDKVLSIIPIVIFGKNNFKYASINTSMQSFEWMKARKWNQKSLFNDKVENFKKSQRKLMRIVVRFVKYILKPSLQNLPATPLEYYIIDEHFVKNLIEKAYIVLLKNIFKNISEGKLKAYVRTKPEFDKFKFLTKNQQALNQLQSKAEKIYNQIINYKSLNDFKDLIK